MKRHVLAMLRNETESATLRVRDRGFDILTPRRRMFHAQNTGLPDGTTVPLRVCDVYAHVARAISPWESEQKRNAGIARLRSEFEKLLEPPP